jgi:glucose-6-phosphate-specific signal transduction histidine kinase
MQKTVTFVATARLALEILLPASHAIAATLLVKATGWQALVPTILMGVLVLRLENIPSPQPALLVGAVATWVIVLVARRASQRRARTAAIAACALCTAALQVSVQRARL